MSYVISDSGNGQTTWYSEKIARDFGASVGWSPTRDIATRFDTCEAAQVMIEALKLISPQICVTEIDG